MQHFKIWIKKVHYKLWAQIQLLGWCNVNKVGPRTVHVAFIWIKATLHAVFHHLARSHGGNTRLSRMSVWMCVVQCKQGRDVWPHPAQGHTHVCIQGRVWESTNVSSDGHCAEGHHPSSFSEVQLFSMLVLVLFIMLHHKMGSWHRAEWRVLVWADNIIRIKRGGRSDCLCSS